MKKTIRSLILSSLLIFSFIGFCYAADVTLAWDANIPAPDGYRLFQRLSTDAGYNYNNPIWTGPETTTTVRDLLPGKTYFFVVRAFVEDNESGDSNEVDFMAPVSNPVNLRIVIEVGVYIDQNGKATVLVSSNQQ